jgi:hypothetical protein
MERIVAGGQPRAFLYFTFGSDEVLAREQEGIYYQSRLICATGGTLLTRPAPGISRTAHLLTCSKKW